MLAAPAPAGLDALFRPRAVAVIGAGRDPTGLGRLVFDGILGYDFQGTLYPVNPKAAQVHSVRAWPSVESIPEPVDMAVIAVPAHLVQSVTESCARKGVKAVVVVSAGFREVGGEGEARERALVELVRKSGMKMVGPNCMGLINTDPQVRLHATFAQRTAEHGVISFMSQSGALGEGVLEHVSAHHIGLSKFVSLGNRADVSPNDLLQAWGEDQLTKVILLYVESFGNPRNFIRIAREVAGKKPVLVVKSGRTPAGAKAARSHTGSLAESDQAVDAMLRQCGVIRIRNVQELFMTASAFAMQPLPKGNRVAIVTNGGGPAIMAVDALIGAGLKIVDLSAGTVAALRKVLPAEASAENPVDMIADAGAERYREVCALVLQDPGVDAMLAIHVSLDGKGEAVANAIGTASREAGKTTLACLFGAPESSPSYRVLASYSVPAYTFPEGAAVALGHMAGRVPALARPLSAPERPPAQNTEARKLLAPFVGAERRKLPEAIARRLAELYGFRFPEERTVTSPKETVAAARAVGFPVVLKAEGEQIIHKSEVGAVAVGIRDEAELIKRLEAMQRSLEERGVKAERFLVQAMAPKGREVFVGVSSDPAFGPIIAVGLGGIYLEVLKDVSFGVLPLSRADAEQMVSSLRTLPLLQGVRGEPPGDVNAVVDSVLRVAALAEDNPEVLELDLNPLIVQPEGKGVISVDARAFVGPPPKIRS